MSMDRAEQILDFAEQEMRKGGVGAVSFRDIASAIGIKSASVHYHFPTKADLTHAVTARYTERFLDALRRPDDPSESPRDRMVRLADAYIGALRKDAATCLCTVLGSVVVNLPEQTGADVKAFYAQLRTWIEQALEGSDTRLPPNVIVSTLQGAMVLSIATGDETPLIDAKAHIKTQIPN